MLLVGILDKIGTFGMIRFCLGLFPEASQWVAPVMVVLALVSILYGAIAAIGSTNLLRLVAYTSISHFGFMVLGIYTFTSTGICGLDLLHGQPRLLDRGAVPGDRLPDHAPRLGAGRATSAASRRWPRCWPGCS